MSIVAKRLLMINYNQYKDIALYSGLISSAFLTYNVFNYTKRRLRSLDIDTKPIITQEQLLVRWKRFLSIERNPVVDFFNKKKYYLVLIRNGQHMNNQGSQSVQSTENDKKYQKLNTFIVDLKNRKKEIQRDEKIFLNFISDYSKVMTSSSANQNMRAIM